MGGSDSKAATSSATSSQQLLDEFKRQQTASQIQGAFNQLGKGVGVQLSPFQPTQPIAQSVPGGFGAVAPPQANPQSPLFQGTSGELGQLFYGIGGAGGGSPMQGMGGAGGGGIDEQTLAMILQRLGYGGGRGSIQ